MHDRGIMTDYEIDLTDYKIEYKPRCLAPKPTEWTCYLFGNRPGGSGLAWHLQKEEVPNRFVRFMMRICFDCYWVKEDD